MKALIKIIILFTVGVAAVYFLRSEGTPAFQRINGWTERTVEHIKSLAAEYREETGTYEESSVAATDDWYTSVPAENQLASGGAEITSHVGLSAAGGNVDMPDSYLPGSQSGNEFHGRSETEIMQWVKEATERYAPTAWHLLMLYDALPAYQEAVSGDEMVMSTRKTASTFAFLDGSSATDLLHSMATNVHEIAHGYCSQAVFSHARNKGLKMSWDDVNVSYYLSPDKTYTLAFPKASLFPSAELVPEIPRELRTFRFDTYVNGNTSTQGEGVLGLLDEFHAYYQGSRCSYDMLDAYVLAEGSEAKGFHEWISSQQSVMTAFWEFDFFIREYLLRMYSHYPDDYALLVRQGEFANAYQGFWKAYSDLVKKYEARVTEIAARIDASGEAVVKIEEGTVWITYPGSSHRKGVQMFDDARAVLGPVINSRRYDNIALYLSAR